MAAVLRAGAFLAAVLRAGAFRAAVLRAGAFRAAVFLTAFFTAVRFAVTFFTAFFTAVRLAAARLATAFLAVVFLAAAFLAGAFFTAMETPSLGFNADLNAEPVANRTPLDAGIGTAAPVRGFLPTRGARSVGENVPKPTTVTFRPDRTSEMIVSNRISTVSSTVRRADCVDSVTAWTS